MSDEWEAGFVPGSVPQRIPLTDEQCDAIKADLWAVGITDDPFTMDPVKRLAWLSSSKKVALTMYAAIKHETRGEWMVQSFAEWCRELGLPW